MNEIKIEMSDNEFNYEKFKTLCGHKGKLYAACVLNNYLITGGEDKTIRVWNLENFSLKSKYANVVDIITSMCPIQITDFKIVIGMNNGLL
jgi:hypothetical protein